MSCGRSALRLLSITWVLLRYNRVSSVFVLAKATLNPTGNLDTNSSSDYNHLADIPRHNLPVGTGCSQLAGHIVDSRTRSGHFGCCNSFGIEIDRNLLHIAGSFDQVGKTALLAGTNLRPV